MPRHFPDDRERMRAISCLASPQLRILFDQFRQLLQVDDAPKLVRQFDDLVPAVTHAPKRASSAGCIRQQSKYLTKNFIREVVDSDIENDVLWGNEEIFVFESNCVEYRMGL